MKTTYRFWIAVSLSTSALLLSACGGAPSESDLKNSFMKQYEAERIAMGGGQMMGMTIIPEMTDLKKIGCKEDGENAYRCDVEVTVKDGKEQKSAPTSVRVVKTSDGWKATK